MSKHSNNGCRSSFRLGRPTKCNILVSREFGDEMIDTAIFDYVFEFKAAINSELSRLHLS